MIYELLKPVFSIVEGILVCEVEHYHPSFRESEVVIDNSSVPFLSGGVPELKVESSIRMTDFFEAVVDANGGFLRIELSVNIADEESTFPNSWPTNDDGLVVLESTFFEFTHLLRFYYKIITNSNILLNYIQQTIFQHHPP